MKIALVHDWLTGMRGGEKVLEVLCEIFPKADLYTLIYLPGKVSEKIENMPIHTSFLQKLPFKGNIYRWFLPLFPLAVEQFNLNHYDLIISSSHCVAKGALGSANSINICYCHSPMRYAWEGYWQYFETLKWPLSWSIPIIMHYLRQWDYTSSQRVNYFIANSKTVASRISKYYQREAEVIHPSVDCEKFAGNWQEQDYFVTISALSPYKRLDIIIEAFNLLGYPLKIIGWGPLEKKLRAKAGKNIEFLGPVKDQELISWLGSSRALVHAANEDFGIVFLEALACGRPVIAYKYGGASEVIIDGVHGLFFEKQNPQTLLNTIDKFEKVEFNYKLLKNRAREFDRSVFKRRLQEYVKKVV